MAIPFRSRPPWQRRLTVCSFLLIGLYWGIVVSLAYLFLHPPRHAVDDTPARHKLQYEDVHFRSAWDPLTLNGWYIPVEREQGKPRGVILFCHGRNSNRAAVLSHALFLHRAGFALLSFDFRNCGDSGGTMTTIGWRETGDALGAIRYLQNRPDTKDLPLGLFGTSMGASVAIEATAAAPGVRCVVADSAYSVLDSAARLQFQGLFGAGGEAFRTPVERIGEWMMSKPADAISPLSEIPKIAPRPILLIHGTKDKVCNVADSRALCKATGNKAQLWIVKGAGHIRAIDQAPREYRQRVTEFFVRNLGSDKTP